MAINRIFAGQSDGPLGHRSGLPVAIRTMPGLGFDSPELRGDWGLLQAALRISKAPTIQAVVEQTVTELRAIADASAAKHIDPVVEKAYERIDALYEKRIAENEKRWEDWGKAQKEKWDRLERELLARCEAARQEAEERLAKR